MSALGAFFLRESLARSGSGNDSLIGGAQVVISNCNERLSCDRDRIGSDGFRRERVSVLGKRALLPRIIFLPGPVPVPGSWIDVDTFVVDPGGSSRDRSRGVAAGAVRQAVFAAQTMARFV